MRCLAFTLTFSAALTMGVMAGCNRKTPASSDDHGHGPPAQDAHGGEHAHGDAEGPEPVVVTLFTPKVELFMEYPRLVKGQQAEFLAHLSVLATGEPVRSGSLTFEAAGPGNKVVSQKLDAPKRDGLFVPTPTFDAAGTFKLRLVVNSSQVQETIDVGEIQVYPDTATAKEAAAKAAEPEPPNVVSFLMEQQWKIGLLTQPVARRSLVRRLTLPAQIIAPQGASAIVSPPVAGRLLTPPSGRFPCVGDRVEAGQVLARVEPPLPITEAAQLIANQAQVQALQIELALRSFEVHNKALDLDRAIVQAKARLEFAQRSHDRSLKLRDKGISTETQQEETEQNLRIAQAEHDSAMAARQLYTGSVQELGRLQAATQPATAASGEQHDHLSAADGHHFRMPLSAPISGTIVSAEHIEGEHLDAHQEVFRVVNTDHVWVQAQVSEADLAEIEQNPGATMTPAAHPDKAIDILSSGGRLVNIGTVVDPQSRSVPIRYELPNPDGTLRVGMFADVLLKTRHATEAIAIPESAVVLDNGRPIAFVLINGENFQRRDLEIGIRDNGFVEVLNGIQDGERVATRGAYAVKLSSLSGASFGAGHGH